MAVVGVTGAGGTAIFRINGTQYQLRGNLKIMPLDFERTYGRNMDGSPYYTEKYVPSFIELEVSDSGGLSLQSFQGFVDEYVTAEMMNGKVYGLSQAVFVGPAELNGVDGMFTARFEGLCTELTS